MSHNPITTTIITIDLANELSPRELASFQKQAEQEGATNLTDHFLNIFVRRPEITQPESAA